MRGFYLLERWLLPALALNVLGYSSLYLAALVAGGDISLIRFAVSTLLAGSALLTVYIYRESLSGPRYPYAGYAFFALWILACAYTASALL